LANRDKRLEYTSVVAPILKYLNSIPNSKAINIHGSVFSERGTPDIIGCINGRTVAFECKRDNTEDLEKIQKWRLSEWIVAGAVVGGVSDLWQVQMILCLMGLL
jgi:mannose/fructose/N-acetylgalactosamine-specific phosphotransferase system component IID